MCLILSYELNEMLVVAVKFIRTSQHNYCSRKTKYDHINMCFLFQSVIRPKDYGGWDGMTMAKYALIYLPFIESVMYS